MTENSAIRTSVFIATSIDGFIARPNGAIDWLTRPEYRLEAEDFGYQDFYDSIDCLVMGRGSMETAMGFSQWPYRGKRVVVMSSTLHRAPSALVDSIELYDGPLQQLLTRLAAEGCSHLYIDGGKTIQSFLRQGLISDLTITRIPVLIGDGIPLFGPLPDDVHLTLDSTHSYPNGFVTSTYRVSKVGPG